MPAPLASVHSQKEQAVSEPGVTARPMRYKTALKSLQYRKEMGRVNQRYLK
jgi:hypothetical protein